ncbi:MAG: ABC transporter ATP-binding protein [Thermoclostridium sp.]|nr:ABC transporter ATP-binding protein [Thermoclostridium sp.]
MKVIFKYIRSLFQYSKCKLILNFLFMVLEGITSGFGILMLVPMLSLTGISEQSSTIPLVNGAFQFLKSFTPSLQLVIVLGIYLVLIIFQAMLSRKLTLLNTELIQGYTKYLRVTLFQSLVKAEWSCFIGKKKSDITNAFTNEISKIASGTIFFLRISSQIVLAIFQLVVALMMSVPMTCLVLLCGILALVLMKTSFLRSKKLGGSQRIISQELVSRITEQLNGVKEVKSYGIEHSQMESFQEITEKAERNMVAFTKLQSTTSMYYKISAAVVISILFYAATIFLKIESTALLIILYIFARLWPVFSSFQNNLQNLLVMIPSYVSLNAMIDELKANTEKINPETAPNGTRMVSYAIRFEDVCFQYQSAGEFELKNLNFVIPAKSTVAFVGKSGSGKSTIVDLLLGLLKPTKGIIKADDKVIDEASLHQWRNSIGYVPQDPFLFNDTIRENLMRFSPTATDEQVRRALQLSDAMEFIEPLPQGLDTVVGDNGVKLSGGQRQRIVLARALLKEPEILVLDEATSALDNESEFRIQKAVEVLSGKLTMIIIAHRLTTIRNSDLIFVVDQGEIVEQGSYDELSKIENGNFRRMIEIHG